MQIPPFSFKIKSSPYINSMSKIRVVIVAISQSESPRLAQKSSYGFY